LLSTIVHLLTRNSLSDIDKHCLEEFRKHWSCLDNNNQQLWQCRRYERPLNKCVFGFPFLTSVAVQKLEKTIPGTPANELPVHERKRQTYAHHKTLT
jgi:NADH dehydrogenase (ubiquinone) 1 alpha subcomplex subunit 8